MSRSIEKRLDDESLLATRKWIWTAGAVQHDTAAMIRPLFDFRKFTAVLPNNTRHRWLLSLQRLNTFRVHLRTRMAMRAGFV